MTTAARPAARPNGWYGMLILVATESALFGTLLASYVYLRFQARTWPPHGIAAPSVTAPLVLALVLVAALVPIAFAARAAGRGEQGAAMAAIAFAFAVQAVYLASRSTSTRTTWPASRPAWTRTARSTSPCSPSTTSTSRSGSCSTCGCSPGSRAG